MAPDPKVICKPFRWLWGLLVLFPVALLVIYGMRGPIEYELTEHAQSALSEAGLTWAVPRFQGRDGYISGTAASQQERQKAIDTIRNLTIRHKVGTRSYALKGVRQVGDHAKLLKKIIPYFWRAGRKRNRIRLKGYVPSEESRKIILGMVKANFPAHEIDDRMTLARGEPARESWLGGISFSMKQLSKMKRGIATLEGTNFSLEGEALTLDAHQEIEAALSSELPVGVKLSKGVIIPPVVSPFIYSVHLDQEILTLSGFSPGEKERTEIFQMAQKAFPRHLIVNHMVLASGAPSQWIKAASQMITALSRLQLGTAILSDLAITLSGRAEDKETAETVAATFHAALPAHFTVTEKIFIKSPPAPVLPELRPYLFSAERANGVLRLAGYISSTRARASLLTFVAESLPDLRVVDELTLAHGAIGEREWLDGLKYGLAFIGHMKFGTVHLENYSLSLAGEAITAPDYLSALSSLASNMPDHFFLRENRMIPPRAVPFEWQGAFDQGRILLNGHVPDEKSRKSLLAFAAKRFSGTLLIDQMSLASGAPQDWLIASRIGLVQLSHLQNGRVTLSDRSLKIEGVAINEAQRKIVRESLAERLPGHFMTKLLIKLSPFIKEKLQSK